MPEPILKQDGDNKNDCERSNRRDSKDSTTIRRRPRHLDVALRFCLQFIKLLAGKSTQGRLCMRHEKFSEAIDSQVD